MCNVISADLITEVLNEFVGEEKSFTAFDVSWEVRNRGGKERHKDMRGEIHVQMKQHLGNNYQQSSITIVDPVKGSVDAQLFHHFMGDPNEYKPKDRSNLTTPAQVAGAVAGGTTPVSQTPLDDDDDISDNVSTPSGSTVGAIAKKRDGQGRLLIPTSFLRNLGVGAGEIVNVFADANAVVVTKDVPATATEFKTRRVERDGDVRVSTSFFVKAGIVSGDEYNITSTDRGVEVTLHD